MLEHRSRRTTTDQRGLPRVGAVDIGDFESQGFRLAGSPVSQVTTAGSPFATPLAVLVSPVHAGDPVDGGQIAFTAPASGPARRSGPPDR